MKFLANRKEVGIVKSCLVQELEGRCDKEDREDVEVDLSTDATITLAGLHQ